ncbi:hypothetical protein [Halosimplex salinum]|uniref:hypothetical protein n=1 Tax=Halosimplex salinum TaxID=1710538 RepID=UPI000F49F48B|nr:hypothetical protein [Halosimplex salinum]
MSEPNQAVVDEIIREGEAIGARGLVELIERYHRGPGVELETIEAYVEELEARDDYAFDGADFLAHVAENTTDADWWEGGVYYEIGDDADDDRISLFPRAWHDHLGGSADVTEYVAFIEDEDPEYLEDVELGGPGSGVPEKAVVEAMMLVGRVQRGDATTAIHEARDAGEIVEDADQSPEADIYLTDRAPEELR